MFVRHFIMWLPRRRALPEIEMFSGLFLWTAHTIFSNETYFITSLLQQKWVIILQCLRFEARAKIIDTMPCKIMTRQHIDPAHHANGSSNIGVAIHYAFFG